MSASLDTAAETARQTMVSAEDRAHSAVSTASDERLRYIVAALKAGWSWTRIGVGQRRYYDRHRQRAGRLGDGERGRGT